MKAQSNVPLPTTPERWKEGQFAYYFNHKDNGIQKEEDEGRRYEAEFVITDSKEEAALEKALTRAILDPVLDKCVIDNIEVESKDAISLVKDYKPDAKTIAEVKYIIESMKIVGKIS
jgi:hypothetical protein